MGAYITDVRKATSQAPINTGMYICDHLPEIYTCMYIMYHMDPKVKSRKFWWDKILYMNFSTYYMNTMPL